MITIATQSVKEKIKEIEELRSTDIEKMLEEALAFYDYAQQEGNDDLKAYASCVLGDACCKNNDFSNAYLYLSEGVQRIAQTEEYLMTCRSLNELGIILRNQGHYMSALEAFANCIKAARPVKELYLYEAMACSNFAMLCIEMDDYEDALKFYQRSIECFNNIEDKILRYDYIICELSFIARVYIYMDDEMKATMTYREMETYISEYHVRENSIEVYMIRLIYNSYIKNDILAAEYLKKVLNLFYSCDNYTIYMDEAYALFEYLLQKEEYEELEKVLNHYRRLEVYDDMVNEFIHIEEYCMKMYEKQGERQKLLEATYRYVNLLSKKTAEAKASFAKTLRLQMQVVQARTENLVTLATSDKDELTQLATKKELIPVFEELFDLAQTQGKTLGLGIVDIDNFKEMVERVGVDATNEVVAEIGNLLREIGSDRIIVSRYSKDEFILVFNDVTDAAIEDVAKYIYQGSIDISRRFAVGKVTFSQGYINRVPFFENRAWDFFAAADEGRVSVRKQGGNNATLIHHINDARTDVTTLF